MRSTAADQLDLGLIDEVVTEDANPFVTVENLHLAILRSYVDLAAMSEKNCPTASRKVLRLCPREAEALSAGTAQAYGALSRWASPS